MSEHHDDPIPIHGLGPCAGCHHDPACGYASVTIGDVEYWLCHTDDHSCYVRLPEDVLAPWF